MELIQTVEAMQEHAEAARQSGRRLGLVPTMGALHEGHLALVRRAREEVGHVTVSIFVNPTQFGPGEDYEEYPRTLDSDLETLEKAVGSVDAVFAPSTEEMYPDGPATLRTWVSVEGLDQHLCGRYRPGHFRGVTTVVTKLLHICRPHQAFFGRKDAQQLVILQRMVRDLFFGVEVVGVPTVREEDGLACSSRNKYLSDRERSQATVLSRAVESARESIRQGEQRGEAIVRSMHQQLKAAPDAEVQYAELVDARQLTPVDEITPGQEVLAAVAVYFGDTRLIDNAFVHAPDAPS